MGNYKTYEISIGEDILKYLFIRQRAYVDELGKLCKPNKGFMENYDRLCDAIYIHNKIAKILGKRELEYPA